MASNKATKVSSKKESYNFPSHFGSHASMIDEAKTKKLNDPNKVVLKDEFGTYVTDKCRLDDGTADPNRYVSSRIKLGVEKKKTADEE